MCCDSPSEFYVTVLREAGYSEAMLGLSLSYGQTWETDTDMGRLRGYEVMKKLAGKDGGHNKFLEAMCVWLDISAPRYWWQEFDTYRIGMSKQSDCFDAETEVLTDNGWVAWPDVSQRCKFATLNTLSGRIEFQRAIALVDEPFCGQMIKIKNNRVDLLVTRKHRLLFEKPSGGLDFCLASDAMFRGPLSIPRWGAVHSGSSNDFVLPSVESCWNTGARDCRVVWDEMSIPLTVWLPFFGFWIAEGSCSLEKRNYNVHIFQNSDHPWFRQVEDMIAALPFKCHRGEYRRGGGPTSVRWTISNRQLYEYLKPLSGAKNKRIPRWYFSLSRDMKEILYYWMFLGDGTKGSGIYSTVSKGLADDTQELLRHIGYSSNIYERTDKRGHVCYTVNPSFARTTRPGANSYSIVSYDGRVYCASVPNGTLYVRRNGIAVWTGNSTMHTILREPLTNRNFNTIIKGEYLEYLNGLRDQKDLVKLKRALPEGFMQRRIVTTNYKSLRGIYAQRKRHKLEEWKHFCRVLEEQLGFPEFVA